METLRARAEEAREERSRTRRAPTFMPAGQSTQMIIGATPAPDRAVLATASHLYTSYRLRRVYYSAFSPIPTPDARLPLVAPPLVREHRLYQADWLLRFYGFRAEELTEESAPFLDRDLDPKTAWALRNRHLFPVDVNRAPRELLLRVPGLGVESVKRILRSRRVRRLRLEDLSRMGATLKRAAPFLLADGTPAPARDLDRIDLRRRLVEAEQLPLFPAVG
jgi:predicted DNA-binding helix-hairpin-helix protein